MACIFDGLSPSFTGRKELEGSGSVSPYPVLYHLVSTKVGFGGVAVNVSLGLSLRATGDWKPPGYSSPSVSLQ